MLHTLCNYCMRIIKIRTPRCHLFADDEDRLREELKDLIDDNPIEESEGEDSDGSAASKKRKKSDDEDFDDRLEDEDYDLIEENLGVKVERVCTQTIYTFLEQ